MAKKYRRGSVTTYKDQFWVLSADSDNEPPQPPWQLSLLHDDSFLPSDGKDGRDGVDGRDGISPPAPKDGRDGQRGADGKSITWRGLFNRRTEYKPNDAVTFDGSSWICVLDCNGREPSDTSRFWNMMAAAGRNGRDGRDGSPGPRGPGSGRLNLLQEQVDELLEGNTDLPEATAEQGITRGQVVYIREDNANLDLAKADAFATSKPIGIAVDTVSAGQICRYVPGGAVTNPDWELEPGRVYFVSDDIAGELTLVEPSDVGDYVLIVGTAASATTLIVEIHRAYVIGPVE